MSANVEVSLFEITIGASKDWGIDEGLRGARKNKLLKIDLYDRSAVYGRGLDVLDVVTGLRRSELIGLKWLDVNFEELELSVTRSVYRQRVGKCKTEISRKPVPLDPWVAEELLTWKRAAPYNQPEDWVFASTRKRGKQPYSPDSLLKRCIRPAAERAKITKHK
jgi:integrase